MENKTGLPEVMPLPWQRLVTTGHVWVARLNAVQWIGLVLVALVVVSGWLDYKAATAGAAKSLSAAASGDHWLVKLLNKPWLTPDAPKPVEEIEISAVGLKPVPDGLSVADLGGRGDILKFLGDQVAALNATGDLDPQYPVVALKDLRQPWVTPAGTADSPLVKKSADGKTIWLASIGTDGVKAAPVFGAFRKRDGRWSWTDVVLLPSMQMQVGRYAVDVNKVPSSVKRDFPELVAK